MITRTEIKGVHYTVDDKLRKYVEKKIAGVDRMLDKHSRESAHLEVTLRELKNKGARRLECETILRLPHDTIVIKEATINMYAAIDIAEVKLKVAIQKYKARHGHNALRKRVAARFISTVRQNAALAE